MRRLIALVVATAVTVAAFLTFLLAPATAKPKPKPGWWCDKHSSQPIKWCAPITRPIPPRKW